MENEATIRTNPKRNAEFERLHQEFIEEAKQRANSMVVHELDKINISRKVRSQALLALKEAQEAGEKIYWQKRLDEHPPNPLLFRWKVEHDAEHPGGFLMLPDGPIPQEEYEPIDPKMLRNYVLALQRKDQAAGRLEKQVIPEE